MLVSLPSLEGDEWAVLLGQAGCTLGFSTAVLTLL